MAVNWNKPELTDTFANVSAYLEQRDFSCAKMDFSGDSNLVTGFVRANISEKQIQVFDGVATWADVLTDYTSHLTDTTNPHSVDETDVGSTTAQWNANKIQNVDVTISSLGTHSGEENELIQYDQGSGDWINRTIDEAGIATTTALTAHIAAANPHTVTAAQASAFAIANNLSEGTAATMRSNLGVLDIALQSDLALDGAYISGVLPVTNGGTNAATAGAARTSLNAAEYPTNADITSMTACTSCLTAASTQTVGTTHASGSLLLKAYNSNRLELQDDDFFPVGAGGVNLGTPTYWFNGLNINTIQSTDLSGNPLTLQAEGAYDVIIGTNNLPRIRFDHADNALEPEGAATANLGTNSVPWNGISGTVFNFTTPLTTAGSLDQYIAVQVNGVAKKIAIYDDS